MPPKRRRSIFYQGSHKKKQPRLSEATDEEKHTHSRDISISPTPNKKSSSGSSNKTTELDSETRKTSTQSLSLAKLPSSPSTTKASSTTNQDTSAPKEMLKKRGTKSKKLTQNAKKTSSRPSISDSSISSASNITQHTLVTSLPAAFRDSSSNSASFFSSSQTKRQFQKTSNLDKAFPSISASSRIPQIVSPIKVKSPNAYLRASLHANGNSNATGPDSAAQSIMESVAGGHKSPRKALPAKANGSTAKNMLKKSDSEKMFPPALSSKISDQVTSRPVGKPMKKTQTKAVLTTTEKSKPGPKPTGQAAKKALNSGISGAKSKRPTNSQIPENNDTNLTIPDTTQQEDAAYWKNKYESLYRLRHTEPESIVNHLLEVNRNSDNIFAQSRAQQLEQEQDLSLLEREKWKTMIDGLGDLKEVIFDLASKSSEQIEDSKNSVLQEIGSGFESVSGMLEKKYTNNNDNAISVSKANGSRSKSISSSYEPTRNDISTLKNELISSYTDTVNNTIKVNQKEMKSLKKELVSIREALAAVNTSRGSRRSDGKNNNRNDTIIDDESSAQNMILKRTFDMLLAFCGITIEELEQDETRVVYKCTQSGSKREFIYQITLTQTEMPNTNQRKAIRQREDDDDEEEEDEEEEEEEDEDPMAAVSFLYTPVNDPRNEATLEKLSDYYREGFTFQPSVVSIVFMILLILQ